jgi:pilus assembly protein CpaF
VTTAVDRLLHAVGTHRIGDQPFIECALPEGTPMAGAHMTVVYAPGASAPSIAIERAPRRPASGAELVAAHVLSAAASKALSAALDARRNVFVVGPRGSGRSTLIASLVAQVAASERVVALEVKPELAHAHRDVAAVPVGKDSKRALEFAHALRPQRLVFAAVDDGLAAGLASALVTGSEGLLAVLEGASASAALARFAAASGHKEDTLGRIAATRPFVLQLARLGDGSARVASMGEARVSDGQVIVDELFTLRVGRSADRAGITAELVETGAHASFTA